MGREITRARVPKTATADNAAATVTTEIPANGQSVYIVAIHASYKTALAAGLLLTVTDGTTTLENHHVRDQRDIQPCVPFKITANLAAVVSLPASGASGNVGAVTVEYYID